jgi:succinyldiaminopimelate transaminase
VAVSPILQAQVTYPFVRLAQKAQEVEQRGIDVIDFGTGDPREPTDARIIEALREGVRERMGYPAAAGLPELRESIAAWLARRFGATADPDRQIIPTLGSKEAIFSFANVVLDPESGKDTVVLTEPGYPVYERGALFAGARVRTLPLLEANGFLPDLDSLTDADWDRVALLWVNFPNNPTGVSAALSDFAALAEKARRHGFVLASDEAYSELWFDAPPASALQLDDWTNVAVFNTLSKRSAMTGYRSGFVAGDRALVAALQRFRPSVGTAPQEFVQRASIVAWGDEEHVDRARASYDRKRQLLIGALARSGIRVTGGAATMYLWVAVPSGLSSDEFATNLLDHGLLVTPGSYLGPSGEGYVRFALVPTVDECALAVEILEDVL